MAVEKTLVELKKLKAKQQASYFEKITQEINKWKEGSWNQTNINRDIRTLCFKEG